jgi:hypothetical protein
MLAFYEENDKVRKVSVPDNEIEDSVSSNEIYRTEAILNLIFRYGQNMFQSQDVYSVSVGDVIELDGRYHKVMPCGFREIYQAEFDELKAAEYEERKRIMANEYFEEV